MRVHPLIETYFNYNNRINKLLKIFGNDKIIISISINTRKVINSIPIEGLTSVSRTILL